MSINFSSLENITTLINNLVKFPNKVEDASPLKHISKLVNDLNNLLNGSDLYDIEIKVGTDQDIKTFKAHSSILKARSPYFKAVLSSSKLIKRSENGIILFEKKNMSPKVFKVLLTYIYNATIDVDDLDFCEITGLLLACDELKINQVIDDLQNYLIAKKEKWVQRDLNHVYEVSTRSQAFGILDDYFEKLIEDNPELFFKSDDFEVIEKQMLVSLLERGDLQMKEIDVWDHVIRWGIGKNQNLKGKKVTEWSKTDFKELKSTLEDLIPLIRFRDISDEEFSNKIMPYQKIFSEFTKNELLDYYSNHVNKPTLNLLPSRGPKFGEIMKDQNLVLLFSSWIDKKSSPYSLISEVKYEFKLLYNSSRDGQNPDNFHQKCDGVNKTLVIGKIENSNQIVGGYNPLDWNGEGYKCTAKSFIFNISDRNDIKTANFSYVISKKSGNAINCHPLYLPSFGGHDLYFYIGGNVLCYSSTYGKINVAAGSTFNELEVFQVIDRK